MRTSMILIITAAIGANSFSNAAVIPEEHPALPIVDLSYAKYSGTALSNGINQFLGIRYAAPPTGSRRFRRAEPPLPESEIQNATEHGAVCYPVKNAGDGTLPGTYNEDCLFIDIYAPAQRTRGRQVPLPVMLWIQGGAFVELVNFNYNGTSLASTGDVVVAAFNYRAGPYGFLANEELAVEGNLNLGLQDQRAAMRWVQKHIHAFGGDPEQVTLFGTSVGGGSVALQTVAYGGKPPVGEEVKWRAGIGEAAYLPSVFKISEQEFHYRQLLTATNCSTLDCLRHVPQEVFQAANTAVPFPGRNTTALFAYGPVIDGSLLPARPFDLVQQGRFLKDKPLILGTSRTEGTIFAPQANTTEEVNDFLRAQFPKLTNSSLARLQDLYNNTPRTLSGITANLSPLFLRAAEMYGDASFACPSIDLAKSFSKAGVPIHFFLDHIIDPVELAAGYVVPHTWEVEGVWGGPEYANDAVALPGADGYEPGGVNAAIIPVVQKYWTSFAKTGGDVNAFRAMGTPVWEELGDGKVLRLQTNATRMETLDAELEAKCAFWYSIRGELGQ